MNSFFAFLFSKYREIIALLMQHIALTSISIVISILVGVPLGILISLVKPMKKPLLMLINLIQAIPTMATLGLLIPILGIGKIPAIVMVVLYSLLPIVKNTYTSLNNTDNNILESANSLGLTKGQTLKLIQIPLAIPFIMSGIRISAVISVGLMTLATLIGAGGLGYLIFNGIQTVNNNMILAGAIPVAILALVIDYIFGKIEFLTSPDYIYINRKKKNLIAFKVILILFCGIIGFSTISSYSISKKNTISIGALNFSEQLILGNMISDLIEYNSNLKVERKFNLGSTSIAMSAMKEKEIDCYIDYTGTLLLNVLKAPMIHNNNKAYKYIKSSMKNKYTIDLLKPLGFNNTYTIATRNDIAQKYNLNTISDLTKVSDKLIFSPTLAFANREDCFPSFSKEYNLKFASVKAMDGALRYSALNNKNCDIIDAFSTEGLLKVYDVKVLKDDKNFFPPYDAVPLIRSDILEKYPELEDIINNLSGKLNNSTMAELNYKVDELGQSPEEVAIGFLKKENLI